MFIFTHMNDMYNMMRSDMLSPNKHSWHTETFIVWQIISDDAFMYANVMI